MDDFAIHTNDIGIAIRDALALLPSVETFDWTDPECPSAGSMDIGPEIDASDASNLIITMANGAVFRVSIVREG